MTQNNTSTPGPMTNSSMQTPPSTSIDIQARVKKLQAAAQKNSPIVFSDPSTVLLYFKHDLSTPHTTSIESYLSYFIKDSDDNLTDIHSDLFLTFLSDYIVPATTIGLPQDIINQMKIAIATKEATLCYKEQGRPTTLYTAHALNRYIDGHLQAGTDPVISIKFPQDIQTTIQKILSPNGQTATTPASSGPSATATPVHRKPPSQPPNTPGPSHTPAHVTFQTPQHVTTRFRRLSTKGSAVTPGIHQAHTPTTPVNIPPPPVSTNPLFPNVGTHTQLCLQALSTETFNTRTFLHSIQDLVINEPTIEGIQKLYRSLDGALMSALKTSHNILPPFMQLNISTSLCDQILGAAQITQQYVDAEETYGIISNQLYTIFTTKNIIGESMTKAKLVLRQRSSTVLCGFDIFYEIMKKYLPQLGADPLNISKLINDLHIQDGDTLFTYYSRAKTTQTNIILSQQIAPIHDLHQKFLSQLMQTDQYKSFLHPTYVEFSQHVRLHKTTPYRQSLDEIYDFLEITGIDVEEPLRLLSGTQQRIISSATHQKKPYIDTTKATSTTKRKFSSNKPKPWELPYHPVTNTRDKCGACGFSGHGPSSCGLRGKEFIPSALAKHLDRFNKMHSHIKPDQKWLDREFPPPPPIREVKTVEFLSDQPDNFCTVITEEPQEQEVEEPELSIDIHAGFSTEVPNQTIQHELHNIELDQEQEEIITEDMMNLTLDDLDISSPPYTPEISYTNIISSSISTPPWITIPITKTSTSLSSSPTNNNTTSENYYSILAELDNTTTINNHDTTSTHYTSHKCPYHSLRHKNCTKSISRNSNHTIQPSSTNSNPSITTTPIHHNSSQLRRLHTILFLHYYHRSPLMQQHYIHLRISRTKTTYRRPNTIHTYPNLQPTNEQHIHFPSNIGRHFLLDIGSNALIMQSPSQQIQNYINLARIIHSRDIEYSTTSSDPSTTNSIATHNWYHEAPSYPICLYSDINRELPDNDSLPSEPPSLISIPYNNTINHTTTTTVLDTTTSNQSNMTDDTQIIPPLVNQQPSTISSDDATDDSITTVYDDDYQQQFWVDTNNISSTSSNNAIDSSQPTHEVNISERTTFTTTSNMDIPTLLQDFEEIADKRKRLRQQILHRTETDPILLTSSTTISRNCLQQQFDTLDILHDNLYDLCHHPHVTWTEINNHMDIMMTHQRVLLDTINDLYYDIDRQYPTINILHVTHNTLDKTITPSSPTSKPPTIKSKWNKYHPVLSHLAISNTPKVIRKRVEALVDSGANTHLFNDISLFEAIIAKNHHFQQSGGTFANSEAEGSITIDIGTIATLRKTLYQPTAPRNIISPILLKQTLGWKKAPHDMGASLSYTTRDNVFVNIPYVTNPTPSTPTPYIKRDNMLDIIVFDVIDTSHTEIHKAESTNNYGMFLHLGLNHAGNDTIQRTITHKGFTDFPPNIHLPTCKCPICLQQNAPKPSAGPTISYEMYKPGQFLFMDFVFFNVESIRGFTSALRIIDGKTSMPFTFATRHKRAPLTILTWFLNYLDRNDKPCKVVRTDRGGELADNTEIRKLFASRGISLQDTGGYAPHKNGKVEARNRPLKNRLRALLQHSPEELDTRFWCFALETGDFADRRLIRRGNTTSPFQMWTGQTPSAKDIHIWGCTVYICNPQTKALDSKNTRCYFLGFGNTTKNIIYYNPHTDTVGQAGKAIFDDFDISHTQSTTPATYLLHHKQLPDNIQQQHTTLDTTSSFFTTDNTYTYSVTIPKTGPLRIKLETDDIFGLPRFTFIGKTSPFYKQLPYKYRKNTFLVRLHDDEPITSDHTLDYIQTLRDNTQLTFNVTVAKAPPQGTTEFQQLVTYCDQLRPIINNTELEASVVLRTAYKPEIPTYTTMKDDPYRQYWIKSLFERYVKNMKVPVWTAPISKSLMPTEAQLFQPVVVRSVRDTADTDVWELYTRICQNENAKQAKLARMGKEKEFGAAYVASPSSLRILLALAAQMNMDVHSGDVSNAFQVTPVPVDGPPRFMYAPPLFVRWFQERYPNIPVKGEAPYVVQLLTILNGAVDAASSFYLLISRYLKEIGYTATAFDMGVFAKTIIHEGKRHYSWIPLMTDDFLVLCTAQFLFEELKQQLEKGLTVEYQSGPVYQFGNYRIIKSQHGISIDQTQAILHNIDRFYINDEISHVKTNIPMRTDKEFNNEMYHALPLDASTLKKVEKLYGASYLSIYGSLINWEAGTRFDIANALHRLGVFQAAPTLLGFQGLRKILDYLRTHPNLPIFYPNIPKTETSTFHSGVSTGDQEDILVILHCLCGHKDVSHAPFRRNRHSVNACVETISGVIADWKVSSQLTCEPSTSGSEIRGYFQQNQRIKGKRNYFKDLGIPESHATPIYEDNKGARDTIRSGRVTKNLKHIDIPLCIIIDDNLEGITECRKCSTHTALSDFISKISSGPKIMKAKTFLAGARYLPPKDSEHYQLLLHPLGHDSQGNKHPPVPLTFDRNILHNTT